MIMIMMLNHSSQNKKSLMMKQYFHWTTLTQKPQLQNQTQILMKAHTLAFT